jgi:hypothetical protein
MYPQREIHAPCHLCRTFCRTIRGRRLLSTFFVANIGSAVTNTPGAHFNSQLVLHILQGSSTLAKPRIVLYTYLCDTQGVNHRESYACLSHCWGQKQPFKLTKQTKSMLQDGLPVSALPATFQDAVLVTRLVGIRFLWIDSLWVNRRKLDELRSL